MKKATSTDDLIADLESRGCGPTSIVIRTGKPTYRIFDKFHTWVNKAQTWMRPGDLCFDMAGRQCFNGGDMMRARDEDAFPVVVVRRR